MSRKNQKTLTGNVSDEVWEAVADLAEKREMSKMDLVGELIELGLCMLKDNKTEPQVLDIGQLCLQSWGRIKGGTENGQIS